MEWNCSIALRVKVFDTEQQIKFLKFNFFATQRVKFFKMADPTARINANKGGIAPLITTEVSIFEPTPYEAYNIFAVDDSALTEAIGQPAAFAQVVRFPLRKRGGRVGRTYVDIDVTVPATPNILAVTAAWVDDLGANILEEIKVKYSSKDVHTYRGEALKFYQRIMDHDITKEHYNGNQNAGLPGLNGEQIRSNTIVPNTSTGFLTAGAFKLRVNLDWLWWTKEDESSLATEALASEIIVELKLRRLEDLIYARELAGGTVVDPFGVIGLNQPAPIARPTISACTMHHELIFTPKVEASKHLARYENRRGLMFKILDFEEQLNNAIAFPSTVAASTVSQKIVLNNFRLDSQFLMFVCRDDRINTPWAIDRTSSDNTFSNVMNGLLATTPAGALPVDLKQSGACIAPSRFRITSNGSTLIDWCTEFENRGIWRNKYFPGSQINGAVYFIPFAKKLREFKHVFGYQNMSNLGNVVLEIEFSRPAQAADRNPDLTGIITDVYNICHNVIQMAQGDIVKALR
jgi:hypothetical protein